MFAAWFIHMPTGGARVFSWGSVIIVLQVTQRAKTAFQLRWLLLDCFWLCLGGCLSDCEAVMTVIKRSRMKIDTFWFRVSCSGIFSFYHLFFRSLHFR